ncbi:MAG: hypothetical protein J0L97_05025 [Alphaproteobacteria bacterium]|nr:hypothetical protein [Alphaproteobacteria bacterium]
MLSLSIILAGVPVQAMQNCPMEKMKQQAVVKQMAKDHSCCPKSAKQEKQKPVKNGCCDDAACNIKCTGSGSLSKVFFDYKTASPFFASVTQQFYVSERVTVSHFLQTQERPPKTLS